MTLLKHSMMAAALVLTAPALAQPAQPAQQTQPSQQSAPQEASIPFVNQGGIRDWQAVGDDKIYVQASGGKWYLATLAAPSPDLPFATTIGFETGGIDRLDRFYSVVIAGMRYPLQSLVESGPPPRKEK